MAKHRPTEYRYSYTGDPSVAALYVHKGKSMLRILQQKAAFQNNNTRTMRKRFGDVIITVSKNFNLYTLHIDAVPLEIEILACAYRGFLTQNATGFGYVSKTAPGTFETGAQIDLIESEFQHWLGLNDRVLTWRYGGTRYQDVNATGSTKVYYRGCHYVTTPGSACLGAAIFGNKLVVAAAGIRVELYHCDWNPTAPYGDTDPGWQAVDMNGFSLPFITAAGVADPTGSSWSFHFTNWSGAGTQLIIEVTLSAGGTTGVIVTSKTEEISNFNTSLSGTGPTEVVTVNPLQYPPASVAQGTTTSYGWYIDRLQSPKPDPYTCPTGTSGAYVIDGTVTAGPEVQVTIPWAPSAPASPNTRFAYTREDFFATCNYSHNATGDATTTTTGTSQKVATQNFVVATDYDPITNNKIILDVTPGEESGSSVDIAASTDTHNGTYSRTDQLDSSGQVTHWNTIVTDLASSTAGNCTDTSGLLATADAGLEPNAVGQVDYIATSDFTGDSTQTTTNTTDRTVTAHFGDLAIIVFDEHRSDSTSTSSGTQTTNTTIFSATATGNNIPIQLTFLNPGTSTCGVGSGIDIQNNVTTSYGPIVNSSLVHTHTARMFLDIDLRAGCALMVETISDIEAATFHTSIYWQTPTTQIAVATLPGQRFIHNYLYYYECVGMAILYPNLNPFGDTLYLPGSLTSFNSRIAYNGYDTVLYCKGTMFGVDFESLVSLDVASGATLKANTLDLAQAPSFINTL